MLVECALTQVEELLELGSTVGGIRDINLTVALHVLVVHVIVVLGIRHHLRQVVIVGHTHLNVIRIGLTQICLGIICEVEAILIPVERVCRRRIFDTIDVAFGITFLLE